MNTLNLNLNLNLNFNSLSLLPLLPVLPRHPCRHWCAWVSVVWIGKKIGCFFKIVRNAQNAFGPWLNGGPVSTYATTTSEAGLVRKSSEGQVIPAGRTA
jgi:hypothetical protein